ncbi:hypothetical protein F5B20DRAFT_417192 [Whalleya microplaca]|nr:hypothetical protein F5B20DRAFT_417192 [Whalleya microplaca]
MASQPPATLGSLTRPLGNLEKFFTMLAEGGAPLNREHWVISLVLGLSFPPSITNAESYLRRSWQLMREQYPELGAVVRGSDAEHPEGKPALIVSPLDINAWAHNTFQTYHDTHDANELFRQLRPHALATCSWIPSTHELMIRSSHWRIDGVGMAKLGHSFMNVLGNVLRLGLDNPLVSYEIYQQNRTCLGPNMEEVVRAQQGVLSYPDDDRGARPTTPPAVAAGADDIINTVAKGIPSIAFPTRDNSETVPPGPTDRTATRLDALVTSKVVNACRSLGVSVTTAVHAAIVRVTAKYPQHPLAKAYAAFTPADLRRVLLNHGEGVDVGPLGLFHLGLPIYIGDIVSPDRCGATKSFLAVAKELNAVYSRDLINFWDPADGSGKMISILQLAESYTRRAAKLFSSPLPPTLPPIQTPDLSSLGNAEKYIQRYYVSDTDTAEAKVEVMDFWMGTEMLTRALQFHLWTWRDELTIAACFNESFYEKDFVNGVLDQVKGELISGLGI